MKEICYRVVKYAFVFLMIVIITDIFLLSDKINRLYRQPLLLSNRIIFFLSSLIVLILILLQQAMFRKSILSDKYIKLFIFANTLVFAVQIFITKNIYFFTGWDAGAIRKTVFDLLYNNGVIGKGNQYYWYSLNPNNLNLTGIFFIIQKIFMSLGFKDYVGLLIVNCIVVNIAGIFTFFCSLRITKNKRYAFFSWIIYTFLVSLSPWISIPYSDTYSIIFPILAYYLYITRAGNENNYLRWFLIGLICFLGYTIKPTSIIVLIAIIIIEIIKLRASLNKKALLKKVLNLSFVLLAIVPTFMVNDYLGQITGSDLDSNKKLTILHYAMMGLNTDSSGGYSDDDVKFSASFETIAKRNEANILVIKERLREFGFLGYLEFLAEKLLVNFSDGSFGWSREGNFYEIIPQREQKISSLLTNYFYKNGKYYKLFLTLTQLLWFSTLILLFGFGISMFRPNYQIATLMLTLIGISIFVMLFEARARYLYNHLPFFTIGAGIGMLKINSQINKETIS